MIDDYRHRILHAAARVYAQHGWRGATTRRIAEEAGVNEVTIFRQFGSKDVLLDTAMRECSRMDAVARLPRVPVNPEAELTEWASAHYAGICANRDIVRQIITDAGARPDVIGCIKHGPSSAIAMLREYIVRLRRDGWMRENGDIPAAEVPVAVSMLMSALFNDAMNRTMMPEMFPQSPSATLAGYVRVFLRGLGVSSAPVPPAPRSDSQLLLPSSSSTE